VARLGAEAADALDHAHGLGILHRDVKPANLLIDPDGSVWITDFGLARFQSEISLTRTGDVVGTLRYMSPEQANARRGVVDQRTDIYALGVTLYEVLTLQPAFNGRDHQELLRQIALDEPVPPRRLNPAVPRDLETIVLKAMAKDPASRYATAQELAADLRRFQDDQPIQARRPGPLERTLRWARRHWELVGTAAAILVISLAVCTTLIWFYAREAVLANNKYQTYIVETLSVNDESAQVALTQAGQLLIDQAGQASRDQASQTYEKVLRVFQKASELPPIDRESRIVIGRAFYRLGYIRTMWYNFKAKVGRPETQLLAEATDDYRRSITLFEKLLAESPGDREICHYLADSLGLYGMGCCKLFANRSQEAERFYDRAIGLRHELVRETGPGGAPDALARADVGRELHNFLFLVRTVQTLAGLLENSGRAEQAQSLRGQLEQDAVAVAARFAGPEFQERRRMCAEQLMSDSVQSAWYPSLRRDMVLSCQLAIIVDPENALAHNNLAWALASVPEDPWHDPQRALALARKAVELKPTAWMFLNTLGVAAFRAGDWKTAAATLQQSLTITGGEAHDLYFLAMIRWRQGKKQEAQELYDRAVDWTVRNRPKDVELRRFQAEAAALLGRAGPTDAPETLQGAKHQKPTGMVPNKTTSSCPDHSSLPRYAASMLLG
jgi:tetratricopeptide (TPR) repeat protein